MLFLETLMYQRKTKSERVVLDLLNFYTYVGDVLFLKLKLLIFVKMSEHNKIYLIQYYVYFVLCKTIK